MEIKQKEYTSLGLDVSTKTIGVALMSEENELIDLTHISPKVKPKPVDKVEELIKKADLFAEFIIKYKDLNIQYIFIEEPLLRSNNVYTVGQLIRFNGMITKMCYDIFGIVPEYISTYESRSKAFPELMQPRTHKKDGTPIKKIGKPVLFGGLPYDIDKKQIILDKVSELEPELEWIYNRNNNLAKENFDMSDAYCVLKAGLSEKNLWFRD